MKLPAITLDTTGLIFKAPTGILWSSQSGGISCMHPEQEGFFVPFQVELSTCDCMCYGTGLDSLDADKALRISSDLQEEFPWLSVDAECADQSTEAWLHVKVHPELIRNHSYAFFMFEFKEGAACAWEREVASWPWTRAVLVGTNCD